MSDICLLMAGVLVKEQTSAPNSLYNSGIDPNQGMQNSGSQWNQLSYLVPSSQIIPPEFMNSKENHQVASTILTAKNQNLLNKITGRLYRQVHSSLVDAKQVNSLKEDSLSSCTGVRDISTSKTPNKLIAKQISNQTPVDNTLPTLSFGQSGLSVKVLQRLLLSNGYAVGVDGVFGAMTETAVKAFQSQRNVVEDGIVGQITWGELTKKW